jgi:hypothetical protein
MLISDKVLEDKVFEIIRDFSFPQKDRNKVFFPGIVD